MFAVYFTHFETDRYNTWKNCKKCIMWLTLNFILYEITKAFIAADANLVSPLITGKYRK